MIEILSPNKYTGRIKPLRIIVEHTMEVEENDPNVAESVARQFQDRGRQASCHVATDTDSDVRVVPDEDTAWAAPGANADGWQHELAGRAGQSAEDWHDEASQKILHRAAKVDAVIAVKFDIPIRHLTDEQIADGVSKGFAGHVDINRVFHASTHWDPGPAFPWDEYLAMVAAEVAALGAAPAAVPAPVHVEPHIDEDGSRGPITIGRWQQVMGTKVDKFISHPESALIKADQRFLNSVVSSGDIQNLTGKPALDVDGDEGPKTIRVRQFWLYNTQAPAVLGRGPRVKDFDGDAGPETTRLHQHALNLATTGSGRY